MNNGFLHEDRDEEVYMKIPQVFYKEGETRVCCLRKSLYGLKKTSCSWYQKFTTFHLILNFKQSKANHSLFIYEIAHTTVIALIYIYNVIMIGSCPKKIQEIKDQLHKEFSFKALGPLKYFFDIEVTRTNDGSGLS